MELFSIGHSNAEINAFIDLLRRYEITALVDTRSQPYSRYNQHFSRDSLKLSLEEAGIEYCLSGQRNRRAARRSGALFSKRQG